MCGYVYGAVWWLSGGLTDVVSDDQSTGVSVGIGILITPGR